MQRSLLRYLQNGVNEVEEIGDEDSSVRVTDLGEVRRLHELWTDFLSHVRPFYGWHISRYLDFRRMLKFRKAMKCNSDPRILKLLVSLGTGFNCSTEKDVRRALCLGCNPADLNLTHPFKTKTLLHFAREIGVDKLSFDTCEELRLVSDIFPEAKLLIRIATYKRLGGRLIRSAFGIPHEKTDSYITLARNLNLSIIGVSFHVEAEQMHPEVLQQSIITAIGEARETMGRIERAGFKVSLIDIGGGFNENGFSDLCRQIKRAIQDSIPSNVEIIGEPGRLLVSSAVAIACRVIAKRTRQDQSHALYLNDSIYENFSNKIHDAREMEPALLRVKGLYLEDFKGDAFGRKRHLWHVYSIHGSTTNTPDTFVESYRSHEIIDCGDWMWFPNMGGKFNIIDELEYIQLTNSLAAYSNSPNWEANEGGQSHKMLYIPAQESTMHF